MPFPATFSDWSIRNKLMFLLLLMSLIAGLSIAVPMAVFDFIGLRHAMANDMAMLAAALSRNSTLALSNRDANTAQEVLDALRAEPSVTAACIYDAQGRPFAKYVRQGDPSAYVPPAVRRPVIEFESQRLTHFRSITLNGRPLGTIYIEADLALLNRRLLEYSVVLIATLVLGLWLALKLAEVLQRPISQPLADLVSTAQAVSSANDYTIRAPIENRDEFGILGSTFNRMLDQIQKRDEELVQHRMELEQKVAARNAELIVANDQLKHAEEKYRSIFEDAVIGIFQATPDGHPISINRAMADIHGYSSPEELIANVRNAVQELFVDPHRMIEVMRLLRGNDTVRDVELELYRKDRSKRWALANIRAVRDALGKVILIEGTMSDITERKHAQEQVNYLAYYDALTGLANRTLLQDRLSQALAGATRRSEKVALLFLDLDRFKIINDSLGHSFGDLLLKEVAARLTDLARAQDTVARIGGDEFLIALTGIKDIPDIAVATDRIMNAITSGFLIQGRQFHISGSIGVSIFPEHGQDSETLIKNADAAMYIAKENGRNAYRFFSDDMNAQVVERMTLEHGLRTALDNHQLFLVYQPEADISTGQIIGYEALLRWNHPELGLVPPDRFIRVAENSGLIVPIGEWVLKTACQAARYWQDQGLLPVPVAVNVSAIQFRHDGFLDAVLRVLQETGLAPCYLELELTESLLMANLDVTHSVLRSLQAIGVKLSIDDFGTGYSSLSYLRQFHVGKLKIDRSFVRNIPSNTDDAAITTAIIGMAKNLNLKVIAEGVENNDQLAFLRAHGCDEVQGYYLSKPLMRDQVTEKFRSSPFFEVGVAAAAVQ